MITADDLPRAVFLDTETTGLGLRDEIIEIAVVDHQGAVLLDTLLSPTVPVSTGAIEVHGIQDADLIRSPSFPDILPRLAAILRDRLVVIYNADFDIAMLEQTARAYGLPDDINVLFSAAGYHCAMLHYAAYWKERGRYGYRWQKLTDAIRQQGIQLPDHLQPHRALADAEMTRQLTLKITQTR